MPDAVTLQEINPAQPGNEVVYRSFRLDALGLEAVGSPSLDDWLACGEFINRSQKAVHFWIGDWLNYGERAWGERYTEALEKTKYDLQTLRNDKWVASRIPSERRRPTLSFDHHQTVAELPPDEQEELLTAAVSQKLNNEGFRKFVRQRGAALVERPLSGAPDKHTPAELVLSSCNTLMLKLAELPMGEVSGEERYALVSQLSSLKAEIERFLKEAAGKKTVRVPVQEEGLDELAEQGWEPDDGGAAERAIYSSLVRRNLFSRLTPRQRKVLICLVEDGMTRKKAARHLLVSLQSIHQIIARVKQRFPEEDHNLSHNLAYFYWLIYPGTDDVVIGREWRKHPVLKDYRKPDKETLAEWYREFSEEGKQ